MPKTPDAPTVTKMIVAFDRGRRALPGFDAKEAYRQIVSECGIPVDDDMMKRIWTGATNFSVIGPTAEQTEALRAHALVGVVEPETLHFPSR